MLQSQPTGISYTSARKRIRQSKPNPLVLLLLILVLLGFLVFSPIRSVLSSPIGLAGMVILVLQGIIYRSLTLAKSVKDSKIKRAIVKRDSRYIVIPCRSLAEGDIVCLQPGDDIEADIRLVVLKDLVIAREEGGKWQVQKKDTTAPLPLNISRSEQSNMVYYGSLVASGEAIGVVVKTYKTTPSISLLNHFPSFYYLLGIWLFWGILLVWLNLSSLLLTIVYLLFIFSVPCHWLSMLEFCLARGVYSLQQDNITIRSPFLLWSLSRVDQILLDLNNYHSDRFDLDIDWCGLWHGDGEKAQVDIPVLHFMTGLALPISQSLALVSDRLSDQELFAKVDVTITSAESDPVMQRQSGIVLGQRELKLLERTLKQSRATFDRFSRVLSFSLTCGLSLLFILIMGKFTVITPLQILWSGCFIPTSLSLLLLFEPSSDLNLRRTSKSLALIWLRNLCLSVILICITTIIVLRFAPVSFAWTVFNFSLLALGCSFLRLSFRQFYQWGITISFVIVQILWIQTARSGMLPLDLVSWIMAILIASGVFWLNKLLRMKVSSF